MWMQILNEGLRSCERCFWCDSASTGINYPLDRKNGVQRIPAKCVSPVACTAVVDVEMKDNKRVEEIGVFHNGEGLPS